MDALLDGEPAPAGALPLPRSVELGSIGVAAARERAGTAEGLFVAVKAGHNGQHHNHLDLGAVEIAVDGVPAVVDPGRPTYDGRTFSPRRYELWPMRSEWHSTLRPRGLDQEPGQQWTATLDGGDDGSHAAWRIDLSDAYPLTEVERLTREVSLDRTTATVTVRDRWRLDGGRETSSVLVLHGEVTAEPGALVVRPPGARALRVRHDADRLEIIERALDDPMLVAAWGARLTRVELVAAADRDGLDLQVQVVA
ncbi:hypothetical protein BJF90_10040 [Pseudonocardia sp. CNS-004]|nr:hypothetical protein BJF90_10040 [Pseudonocardia sp. CNS-004]